MALLIQEPISIEETGLENKQEIILGIDLGTTNSLVAIIENNKPRFFCDEKGLEIHSSVVSFDDNGKILEVGNKALEDKNSVTISSIKRLMGKNFDDVKNIKDQFNFRFDEENKDHLKINIKNCKYSPEEISAEILKYLKNLAENNLKIEVKKAVITVPAYFDESAKNATKLAANLAGLEVLRLVNEPTAAALAYGLDNSSEGIYCIYDLGGGTFDVSILKMQKGVFKVLGVAGDNALGGDDFDELLAKKLDISKSEARKIKEELSKSPFAANAALPPFSKGVIQSAFVSQSKDLVHTISITKTEFENLISEKIQKTIKLTNNLIDDLELEIDEIKGVVLVGGSTRIPLIKSKLAEIFGDNKVLTNLDPDRVVAIGAAWQADNLSGKSNNLLLDVVPLSLGIEMMGGIVDKVIYRNNTVPTSITKEFTTYADFQTGMQLHIVQGERELAEDCRSLARFEIKNIPAMKAGFARVAVTFKVDADGILTVLAEEKLTGEKQEIIVKPTYGLDEIEVQKLLLESQENAKTDIEKRLLAKAILDAKKDITILQDDLRNFSNLISQEEKEKIEKAIINLEKLFDDKNNRSEISAATQELEKVAENFILQKVNSIVNKNLSGRKVNS
jgi:molecular chaperone HscA